MRTFLAITVATLTLAGSAATAATSPTLHPMRGSTLTLRGLSWKAGEHVVLTLHAQGTETVRTVAGADGKFTARFVYVPPRCSSWLVVAVGSKSGRITYRNPRRECAPVD